MLLYVLLECFSHILSSQNVTNCFVSSHKGGLEDGLVAHHLLLIRILEFVLIIIIKQSLYNAALSNI